MAPTHRDLRDKEIQVCVVSILPLSSKSFPNYLVRYWMHSLLQFYLEIETTFRETSMSSFRTIV